MSFFFCWMSFFDTISAPNGQKKKISNLHVEKCSKLPKRRKKKFFDPKWKNEGGNGQRLEKQQLFPRILKFRNLQIKNFEKCCFCALMTREYAQDNFFWIGCLVDSLMTFKVWKWKNLKILFLPPPPCDSYGWNSKGYTQDVWSPKFNFPQNLSIISDDQKNFRLLAGTNLVRWQSKKYTIIPL